MTHVKDAGSGKTGGGDPLRFKICCFFYFLNDINDIPTWKQSSDLRASSMPWEEPCWLSHLFHLSSELSLHKCQGEKKLG